MKPGDLFTINLTNFGTFGLNLEAHGPPYSEYKNGCDLGLQLLEYVDEIDGFSIFYFPALQRFADCPRSYMFLVTKD